MEIKSNSKIQSEQEQNAEVDYKPLIDLFELLFEWEIEDVQEKEEKRKEIS